MPPSSKGRAGGTGSPVSLKGSSQGADAYLWSSDGVRGSSDSSAASELRATYCCIMCHKHCRIPCKLTAAEFRQMEQAMTEATASRPGDRGDLTTVSIFEGAMRIPPIVAGPSLCRDTADGGAAGRPLCRRRSPERAPAVSGPPVPPGPQPFEIA